MSTACKQCGGKPGVTFTSAKGEVFSVLEFAPCEFAWPHCRARAPCPWSGPQSLCQERAAGEAGALSTCLGSTFGRRCPSGWCSQASPEGLTTLFPPLANHSFKKIVPGKPSEGWTHEELCCSLVNTAPQSPSRCLGARYSREDLPFWKRVPVHATLTCLNTSPLAELLQTLLNPRHSTDVEDNQVSLARR